MYQKLQKMIICFCMCIESIFLAINLNKLKQAKLYQELKNCHKFRKILFRILDVTLWVAIP